MDDVLSTFIVETQKENGEKYPPRTLYQLLSGLHRYASLLHPDVDLPQFCSSKLTFRRLHRTLNNLFKELCVKGVGSSSKHHDPISKQDINQLWETGVLSVKAPMQLLNAVFFTTGLYCCLCGGEEHRSLCFSDFKRTSDPDMWTYTERASKNWQGGLLNSKLEHKTVPIHVIHSAGECCPVSILDLYFTKVPAEAIGADSAFISVHLRGCLMMQCYLGFQIKQWERTSLTQWQRECVWLLVFPPKTNHSLEQHLQLRCSRLASLKRLFRRDQGIDPQKLCGCMSESQMSNKKQQQQYFPPLIRQITIHCFQ